MVHANNENVNVAALPLRHSNVVMNAERLGAMHQTRISLYVLYYVRSIGKNGY